MSRVPSGREKGKGKEQEVDRRAPFPSASTTSQTLPTSSSISSTKPSQRSSQQQKKKGALRFEPGVGFNLDRKPATVPPIPVRRVVTCSVPTSTASTVIGSQAAKGRGKGSKRSLAPVSMFLPSRSPPKASAVEPGPSQPALRPPSPSQPDCESPSSPPLLFRSTATPSPKRRRTRHTSLHTSPLKSLHPPQPPNPTPPPPPIAALAPSSPDLFFYESPPSSSTHSTQTPPPKLFTSPTPRKRSRPTSEPDLEPDWSQCDPRLLNSNLFRSEYLIYGNPDYRQAYKDPYKPKPSKRIGSKKSSGSISEPAVAERRKPSWLSENIKLPSNLAGRLLTDEEFLAVVWAKDIVGSLDGDGEKKLGTGMRLEWIDGTKVYLLGEEFPCLKVTLMGYIIGVDVKEDEGTRERRVTHHVDDSTAVVQCTCTLPAPTRSFIPVQFVPRIYPEEGGISRAVTVDKRPAEVEPAPVVFEVGTLVQVIGRVTEGSFAWQERSVVVDKIEALRDATLEADHHVLVDRMHRTVYDVPLDLEALLEKGEAAEKERSWETASLATSEAGSPRKYVDVDQQEKRFKLADPNLLDPARLTLSTFITYINNYLRNHRLGRPPGPSSRPSSQSSSYGLPWGNSSLNSEDDLPRPFTIDDLERNKRLKRFAELMAQRNEVLRRLKKKAKVQPFDPKVWIAKPEAELKRRHSGASGLMGSTEGRPLDETGLAKATRRIFVDAIRTMRKDGKILVSECESFSSPLKLPEVKISPVSTRTAKTTRATDLDSTKSTWSVLGLGASSRDIEHYFSPWGEIMDANDLDDFATPKAKRSSSKRVDVEEASIGPWRLSDATDFEKGLGAAAGEETPRAGSRSLFQVPPVRVPYPHPGDISSSTSAGNTTWSTSMMESTTECFELVTTTSLEPQILRILKEATSDHTRKGLMVESIRKILAMDPRWEAVAVYSPLVSNALDELELAGRVRRSGHYFSTLE